MLQGGRYHYRWMCNPDLIDRFSVLIFLLDKNPPVTNSLDPLLSSLTSFFFLLLPLPLPLHHPPISRSLFPASFFFITLVSLLSVAAGYSPKRSPNNSSHENSQADPDGTKVNL
ncbi:hypothetical protein F4815DRAFT_57471 [Daldinia loculata]|nr:hypothetical protein F4815DRAFT_57471 [Daldinia loculata]